MLRRVIFLSCLITGSVAFAATPAPVKYGTFLEYSEGAYPDIYAKWGKAGVERIKLMERKAVDHVAWSPACDRIITVEPNSAKSNPPTDVVVSVVCDNGNRFYVDADALSKPPEELAYEKIF